MSMRVLTEEEIAQQRAEESKFERIGTTTEDGKWVMGCPDCYYGARIRSFGKTECETCKDEKVVVVDPIETRPFCTPEDHTWWLEFEGGSFNLRPKDPHTLIEQESMRRHDPDHYPATGCEQGPDIQEMLAGDYEVRVRGVNDSTSAGPWGPAEYDYYFEIVEGLNGNDS